jgi:hypothetical protein
MQFAEEAELRVTVFTHSQHLELTGVEVAAGFSSLVHVVGFAAPSCPNDAPRFSNADGISSSFFVLLVCPWHVRNRFRQ